MQIFTALIMSIFFQTNAVAAIYGTDQRKDIHNTPPNIQKISQSIALNIPRIFLQTHKQNTSFLFHDEHTERNYQENLQLCPTERFLKQNSFGHCTSFLVHPKVIATAGHCMISNDKLVDKPHAYCDEFKFWFGYNTTNSSWRGSMIPQNKVFKCKKVIYAANITDDNQPNIDFALLELDQPVTDTRPIKLSTEVSTNQTVYTLGHPHGLPAKYSGTAQVHKVNINKFLTNLDTLGGNSGGPVLNINDEVIGILIAGHQHDDYRSKSQDCYKINTCDPSGKKCKNSSTLEPSNVVLKTSVWKRHLDKYIRDSKI